MPDDKVKKPKKVYKWNRHRKYSDEERVIIVTYEHLLDYDRKLALEWLTEIKWEKYKYQAERLINRHDFTLLEQKVGMLKALYLFSVRRLTELGEKGYNFMREIHKIGLAKTEAEAELQKWYEQHEDTVVEMAGIDKDRDEEKAQDNSKAVSVSAQAAG